MLCCINTLLLSMSLLSSVLYLKHKSNYLYCYKIRTYPRGIVVFKTNLSLIGLRLSACISRIPIFLEDKVITPINLLFNIL